MRAFYSFLITITAFSVTAQVVEVASDFNYLVFNEYQKRKAQGELKIATDTLDLPFFDDFAYEGPYPDQNLWLDNNVFVNKTIGIDPPSVGMATFDGLNSGGAPYGGAKGRADFLTSQFLDLSSFNPSDDLFLSFFIQAKGRGDSPGETDSLTVEFKNEMEEWEEMASYRLSDASGGFVFRALPILNDDFFHEGFQFRFVNIAGGGFKDLWHLDYVKLIPNGADVPFSSDIAFVNSPSNILKNYTSMPWHHFIENIENEINDEMHISLFNHFEETNSAEPSAFFLEEINTGITVIDEPELLKLNSYVNQKDVPPNQVVEYTNPLPDFANAINDPAFDTGDALTFNFVYEFEQNEETALTAANNVVNRRTVFDNYLAYDDGTGESNLAAKGAGTQLGVKFTTNVGDSLKSIQVHIPHFNGNVENQFFNLRVHLDDLDSEPIFDRDLLRPFYVNNVFDTLQGFTTYRLENFLGEETPVFIPEGDFFIVWQQVNDEFERAIPIGYDLNSSIGYENLFQNIVGGWVPLDPSVPVESLKLKPVIGIEPAINTEVVEVTDE